MRSRYSVFKVTVEGLKYLYASFLVIIADQPESNRQYYRDDFKLD